MYAVSIKERLWELKVLQKAIMEKAKSESVLKKMSNEEHEDLEVWVGKHIPDEGIEIQILLQKIQRQRSEALEKKKNSKVTKKLKK
jgi:hypothetical protein